MNANKSSKRHTLSDTVKNQLRNSILSGTLKPGEMVVMDVLAKQFGTSRLPIRDALRGLMAEGLISTGGRRSSYVTRLSLDEIEEMLEIATSLEALAVRKGAENLRENDLQQMARLLEEMRVVEGDPWSWFKLNVDFHTIITKASGWNRLISLVRDTRMNVGRFISDHELFNRQVETWHAQHVQIYEACVNGQASEVLMASEFHWRYSNHRILEHLAADANTQKNSEERMDVTI